MPPCATGVPGRRPSSAAAVADKSGLALAQRRDALRPLARQVVEADLTQQSGAPAAVGTGVIPLHGDVIEGKRPFAGQPVHEPVGAFDDAAGPAVDLRLVPLQPERLGQHPFRRQDAGDPAQHRVFCGADVGGLAVGALVHPQQRAAQRRAVEVAGDDGAGGAVEADAGHVIGSGGGAGQRFGHGGAGGGPPLIGVLFGPGRLRMERLQRGDAEAATGAGRVEQGGADALGADVEAEEQGRGSVHCSRADVKENRAVEKRPGRTYACCTGSLVI